MTKKHFEAIAAAIKERMRFYEGTHGASAVRDLAYDLAKICADTNPRFDAERFLKACGLDV